MLCFCTNELPGFLYVTCVGSVSGLRSKEKMVSALKLSGFVDMSEVSVCSSVWHLQQFLLTASNTLVCLFLLLEKKNNTWLK